MPVSGQPNTSAAPDFEVITREAGQGSSDSVRLIWLLLQGEIAARMRAQPSFATVPVSCAISALTDGLNANSLVVADYAQVWNWALATPQKQGLTIGESSASTNGGAPTLTTSTQSLLGLNTLALSSAIPLYIKNLGNANAIRIDNDGAATFPFIIDTSGRMGLGTLNPQADFHLVDAADGFYPFLIEGSVAHVGIFLDANKTSIGTVNNNPFSLFANNQNPQLMVRTGGAIQLMRRRNPVTSLSSGATGMDDYYLEVGGYEAINNGYYLVGFGYVDTTNNGTTGSAPPAFIGFQEKSNTGYTKGDLVFGTRDVTTDTPASVRLTIDAAGNATFTGTVSASGFSGGGGGVTTTGSPASGNLTKFSGASTITNGDLSGHVTTSGTLSTTIANSVVTEAMQTLADNTTANVSTTKHGYAPKAPNDSTKFLDGTGAYSVPGGGGGGSGSPFFTSGSGNPQGSTTADAGTIYVDTANGNQYRKIAGSGNTGWYPICNKGPIVASQVNEFGWRASPPGNTLAGNTDNIQGDAMILSSFSGSTLTAQRRSDSYYMRAATTTGAGANSGLYDTNFGTSRFQWDTYNFDIAWKIRTDSSSLSDIRYWVGLSTADPTNSNTMSGNCVLFRYANGTDTQWVGVVRDGTTQNVTGNIAAIAANTAYTLRIRYVSGTVYFSVNDGAEVSTSTNVPTGSSNPYLLLMTTLIAGGTSRNIELSRLGGIWGT